MNEYEARYSTAHIIERLMIKYGAETSLSKALGLELGLNIYKCPKCDGRGYIKIEYNGYPRGLPDSGFVYEAAYKDNKCDLCNGIGYTSKKMQPRMIMDGWTEDCHAKASTS